jgi:hypothetical protein
MEHLEHSLSTAVLNTRHVNEGEGNIILHVFRAMNF